jgi:hypothetical protein
MWALHAKTLLFLAASASVAAAPPRSPEVREAMGHRFGSDQATRVLQHLFPPGTREDELLKTLHRSNFAVHTAKDGTHTARSYIGGGLACTDILTVTWKVAPGGTLTDLKGDVEGTC